MLIEDVACPVNKLAEMTVDLVEMFQKFGYKDASCFGHALEGNLHLVFSQVRHRRPQVPRSLPPMPSGGFRSSTRCDWRLTQYLPDEVWDSCERGSSRYPC